MKPKTKIKNIWIVTLLSLGLFLFAIRQCIAQERFTTGIYLEPQHFTKQVWDGADGFNIGGHIELQQEYFYIRARVFLFPDLNDLPYFDFDGGVGLQWRDNEDKVRFYSGAFIGLINRNGWGYMKSGYEIGADVFITKQFYIGIKGDYQYKHDDKIWRRTESGHEVYSAGLVLGYTWKQKQ
jgi:hypothetical protein